VKQVENLLQRARGRTNVDFAVGIMRTGGAAQRIESVTLTAR